MPRKREIEAAIAAYNAADPEALLPPDAARLLAVMFRGAACANAAWTTWWRRGSTEGAIPRLLRALVEAGFLSKERRSARAP